MQLKSGDRVRVREGVLDSFGRDVREKVNAGRIGTISPVFPPAPGRWLVTFHACAGRPKEFRHQFSERNLEKVEACTTP